MRETYNGGVITYDEESNQWDWSWGDDATLKSGQVSSLANARKAIDRARRSKFERYPVLIVGRSPSGYFVNDGIVTSENAREKPSWQTKTDLEYRVTVDGRSRHFWNDDDLIKISDVTGAQVDGLKRLIASQRQAVAAVEKALNEMGWRSEDEE